MDPALQSLLGRYSVGPKHLVEPGPDDAQLSLMVQAALRAPDHAELVPYRFKLVRGAAKQAMADLFADAARAAGKGEEGAALDAERALRPPVTVAVVARIDLGHPQVPAHEQWAAVGGAISNFLTAAHALSILPPRSATLARRCWAGSRSARRPANPPARPASPTPGRC